MTKSELLNTAIKIFGLYYFVRFVQHVIEFIFMIIGSDFYRQPDSSIVLAGISLTFVVDLAFAYFALFRTELISNKISKSSQEAVELGVTKTDLLEIALAIVAILTILSSIPDLLTQQVNSIYYHDNELEFWTTDAKNQLFKNLFMLVAGFFLLLNARNFSKWIVKNGSQDDVKDEADKL